MCHEEKSVSCCQNSCMVSVTKVSASLGRFFSILVVSWDVPGALSLFIFAMVLLILSFCGVNPSECCTGHWWILSIIFSL
jgi:hypothetical protein